jgi:hypothetical protein
MISGNRLLAISICIDEEFYVDGSLLFKAEFYYIKNGQHCLLAYLPKDKTEPSIH